MALISTRARSAEDALRTRTRPPRNAGLDDEPEQNVQARQPVGSWSVAGERIAFAIVRDGGKGSNRLVKHERPYREGSKIDDTGSACRTWTTWIAFNNTLDESGLEANGGEAPYPDGFARFVRLFNVHETGDLVLPLLGKVRARGETYSYVEETDETDHLVLEVEWSEDNEDKINAASFSTPSVSGALAPLARQARFTAESEGTWSGALEDLIELCGEIEGLMKAPGEFGDAVVAKIQRARLAISKVKRTARESLSPGGLVSPPTRIFAELARLSDVVGFASEQKARAKTEAEAPRKRKVWRTVKERTSIYKLAALVRQPPEILLEINAGRIDDPFVVLPGRYRIFETWP